jgi:hypothetical protein
VRENRTHGSEGGDGESSFRPLSVFGKENQSNAASYGDSDPQRLKIFHSCRAQSKHSQVFQQNHFPLSNVAGVEMDIYCRLG